MDFCTPALVTGLIFTLLIVYDLERKNYDSLPPHVILGLVCVLLMGILCQNGAAYVAWGILAIPGILLFLPVIFYLAFLIYWFIMTFTGNTVDFKVINMGSFGSTAPSQ
jgi:hypothetical protein